MRTEASIYSNYKKIFRSLLLTISFVLVSLFLIISFSGHAKHIKHEMMMLAQNNKVALTQCTSLLNLEQESRETSMGVFSFDEQIVLNEYPAIDTLEIIKQNNKIMLLTIVMTSMDDDQTINVRDTFSSCFEESNDYVPLIMEFNNYTVEISSMDQPQINGYSLDWNNKQYVYYSTIEIEESFYGVSVYVPQMTIITTYIDDYFYIFIFYFVAFLLLSIVLGFKIHRLNYLPLFHFVEKFKVYSEKDLEFFIGNDDVDNHIDELSLILKYFKHFCEHNKIKYDHTIKNLNTSLLAAKEGSKSKSAYLANMSHEMRTPLNSIIGYSQLIEKLDYDDVDKVKEYVERINISSNLLYQKINDILDLAKIEANQFQLIKEPSQIKKVIQEVYDLLVVTANKKGIHFFYHIDPQIPNYVMMDQTRFKQVLINLCSNAIKYTNEGYVKLEIELFGFINDAIVLDYKVSDTGVGISSDGLEKIFIPFVQVGNMTHQGTGLGLTITRDFIRLMGGEVTVTSKVGVGTIFSFTTIFELTDLTMIRETEHEDTDQQITALIKDCQILVVEDNIINQVLITEIFSVFNKRNIDLASDGLEAIDMCRKKHYDLIFMDIQMPNCDGVQATIELRKLKQYQHTPIIALTANAFSEQVSEYISFGMTDYLKKPLDITHLKKILSQYLKDKAR